MWSLNGLGLQDFDAYNSSEINDFRFNMKKMGERIAKDRSRSTWQEKLWYQFPPRMSEVTSSLLIKYESNSHIRVEVKCVYENGSTDNDRIKNQEVCDDQAENL